MKLIVVTPDGNVDEISAFLKTLPRRSRLEIVEQLTRVRPKDVAFRKTAPKGPFLWLTHSGDLIAPADMATQHLYYSIRMLFNHTVPAKYRTPESVQEIKKYTDVPKWSKVYKKAATKALRAELNKRSRTELTPAMRDGLRWITMVEDLLAK